MTTPLVFLAYTNTFYPDIGNYAKKELLKKAVYIQE